MVENDIRYLRCLAKQYPTIAETATEIINLQSILSLPKGTEHFITDIHGEYEQFQHITKNTRNIQIDAFTMYIHLSVNTELRSRRQLPPKSYRTH